MPFPLNYRYTSDEIKYTVELSEANVLLFGPEFIGRVEEIAEEIGPQPHAFLLWRRMSDVCGKLS